MENFQTEIRNIIEKNLPMEMGNILKERLAKAEEDAELVKRLKKDKEIAIEENRILSDKLSNANEKLSKHGSLDNRMQAVTERENTLEINRLKYELQAEKDKTDHAMKVAMGLVRNVEYRNTTFGNIPDSRGGSLPTHSDETKRTE